MSHGLGSALTCLKGYITLDLDIVHDFWVDEWLIISVEKGHTLVSNVHHHKLYSFSVDTVAHHQRELFLLSIDVNVPTSELCLGKLTAAYEMCCYQYENSLPVVTHLDHHNSAAVLNLIYSLTTREKFFWMVATVIQWKCMACYDYLLSHQQRTM